MALDQPTGQPGPLAPGEFVPSAPANQVTFKTTNVDLPSALYLQRDDVLLLRIVSIAAAEVVSLNYRLLLPNGVIQNGQFTLKANSIGTFASQVFTLAEGFLLSMTCVAAQAGFRGQTYAQVVLQRSSGAGAIQTTVLFADYVTQSYGAAWPAGRIVSSQEGPGYINSLIGSNPGAGNNMAIHLNTSPQSQQSTRLATGRFLFTTSATVANRIVELVILDETGTNIGNYTPNQVVVASQGVNVTVTSNASVAVANSPDVLIGIPSPMMLKPFYTIETQITNLQVGDTITNINFQFESWLLF